MQSRAVRCGASHARSALIVESSRCSHHSDIADLAHLSATALHLRLTAAHLDHRGQSQSPAHIHKHRPISLPLLVQVSPVGGSPRWDEHELAARFLPSALHAVSPFHLLSPAKHFVRCSLILHSYAHSVSSSDVFVIVAANIVQVCIHMKIP